VNLRASAPCPNVEPPLLDSSATRSMDPVLTKTEMNGKPMVRFTSSSALRQPTPAHRSSLSTKHLRPSGFFDCGLDGLETRYQTNSQIRRVVLTVLGSFLRQSSLLSRY